MNHARRVFYLILAVFNSCADKEHQTVQSENIFLTNLKYFFQRRSRYKKVLLIRYKEPRCKTGGVRQISKGHCQRGGYTG